ESSGYYYSVMELEERTEQVDDKNKNTPCIRKARSLLLLAFASELAGHTDRARELEQRAEELQNEGYGATLATPRAHGARTRRARPPSGAACRRGVDATRDVVLAPGWRDEARRARGHGLSRRSGGDGRAGRPARLLPGTVRPAAPPLPR